jgi:Rrf2 family protein
MKLSRSVVYALRASLELARCIPGIPVSARQLAAADNSPDRFLVQLLLQLVRHGILSSARGVDGGYSFERNPEEISLLEIIEAIDGPITASLPSLEGGEQSAHESKLREALEKVTRGSREQLAAIKLSDLLGLE